MCQLSVTMTTARGIDFVTRLPEELAERVLEQLSLRDLLTVSQCSSSWCKRGGGRIGYICCILIHCLWLSPPPDWCGREEKC